MDSMRQYIGEDQSPYNVKHVSSILNSTLIGGFVYILISHIVRILDGKSLKQIIGGGPQHKHMVWGGRRRCDS